ncbi:MAG: ribosome-binding factor A [Alphaproteobacteria bacterium]|jgi:ribosome-binding factor A
MVKRFSSDTPSPRQAKYATRVRELVAAMIIRDEVINVKPLDLTINAVSVSPDLRQASIYVTPRPSGTGKKARTVSKIMANLINARKFMRLKIAQDLTSKVCPELHFFQDDASKNAEKFDTVLEQIKTL